MKSRRLSDVSSAALTAPRHHGHHRLVRLAARRAGAADRAAGGPGPLRPPAHLSRRDRQQSLRQVQTHRRGPVSEGDGSEWSSRFLHGNCNFRTLWKGEVELFVPPIGDGEGEQEMGDIVERFLNKQTERLSLVGPGESFM